MTHGGRRPGSGPRKRDTVRISVPILRPVYLELLRLEEQTGTYRCRLMERIVTEALVERIVERELADVRSSLHAASIFDGHPECKERVLPR